MIQSFRVHWAPDISTHAVIKVTFKDHVPTSKHDVVRMPSTIKQIFTEVCKTCYGDYNSRVKPLNAKRTNVYSSEV